MIGVVDVVVVGENGSAPVVGGKYRCLVGLEAEIVAWMGVCMDV